MKFMKITKKLFLISIIFLAILSLPTISLAQQLTISCDPCYVNNCQCFTKCNSGKMYVYAMENCQDTASYIITVSNRNANFFSIQPGLFYTRVDCTETGQISTCQPLYVASYSEQPITTTASITTTSTITQTQSTQTQTTSTTTHTYITTRTTTATQPTQSTQATLTTTLTQTTRTTKITQTKNLLDSSLNTIFIVILVVALVVIVGVLLIHWRSKTSTQKRYESLKQKWGR